MAKHIVCISFDFDAMSGWIARGMTTPTPVSRGEFGVIAAGRILALLKKHGIPATWFIPGHTLETYPNACEQVLEARHEIGHHGWTHVPPASLSRDEEEAELVRANEQIRKLTGRRARLPLAVVGPEPAFGRAFDQARLLLRKQHDGERP